MRPEVDLGDLLPDDDDLVDAYDPPAWPEPRVAPEPEPEPPVAPSPPMKPEPAPGLRSETAAAIAAARASLGTLRKDQYDGHTLTPKDDVVAEAEVEVRRAGEAIAREIDAEVAARSEGLDQEAVERLRCDVTVEVLGRIRPLGLPEGETLISVDSHKPALAAIHKAATRFPSDWLRASQEGKIPLRVRSSYARCHYASVARYRGEPEMVETVEIVWQRNDMPIPPDAEVISDSSQNGFVRCKQRVTVKRRPLKIAAVLTVPPKSSESQDQTATHELTHRMEDYNPTIGLLERRFLARRCGMPPKFSRYGGRRSELVAVPTDAPFADEYVGKVYDMSRFREVMSVGTQSVFCGDYGGLVESDPDHRAFVLGVLASA